MIQKDPEVAALARAAHDHIATHGLHKGDYWPTGGGEDGDYYDGAPACTLGALGVASHLREREDVGNAACGITNKVARTSAAIIDTLDLGAHSHHARVSIIGMWNDQPERTQDEVLAVLDEVATKSLPDETGSTL